MPVLIFYPIELQRLAWLVCCLLPHRQFNSDWGPHVCDLDFILTFRVFALRSATDRLYIQRLPLPHTHAYLPACMLAYLPICFCSTLILDKEWNALIIIRRVKERGNQRNIEQMFHFYTHILGRRRLSNSTPNRKIVGNTQSMNICFMTFWPDQSPKTIISSSYILKK